jgi:hypothetical protein
LARLTFDHEGRTIWIVDGHGYGKHFIVRADEILTAFVELEQAIDACGSGGNDRANSRV